MQDPSQPPPLDRAAFRHVIGHFASGVAVITCQTEFGMAGMTASAVASVSLEPPMLLICLNQQTTTQRAVHDEGLFGVNVLHEDQGRLAERFATFRGDKFKGLGIHRGPLQQPLIDDALAGMECRVVGEMSAGTHRIFVAEVVHAQAGPGSPLAYYRGRFGRLLHAEELQIYDVLRRRALNAEIGPEDRLDVSALAAELAVPAPAAYYALTRLVGEGVLSRVDEDRYRVADTSASMLDAVIDARFALESGAVDLTLGLVGAEDLAELRRRQRGLQRTVVGGRVRDTREFAAAYDSFHQHIIGMARNETLLSSFMRLIVPGFGGLSELERDPDAALILENHDQMVGGYERRDLRAVHQALAEHRPIVKRIGRRALDWGTSL